ncbi:MAG: DUF4279 domain-containing protein [Burkholderiaceae bacterium]|jgi:hypothetical protein
MTDSPEVQSHRYTVELRFFGDNLEPADISTRLGLTPSSALSRLQIAALGRPRLPYWAYNGNGEVGFSAEWGQLEEGLRFLVSTLRSRQENVVAIARQFKGVWWCGHFQASFSGGPTLSPSLMRDLGKYEIPLSIDNYFSEQDEADFIDEVPPES